MARYFLVTLIFALVMILKAHFNIPPNDPRWQTDYEQGMYIHHVCNSDLDTFQSAVYETCEKVLDVAKEADDKLYAICASSGKKCPEEVTSEQPFFAEYALELTKQQLKIAEMEQQLLLGAEQTPKVNAGIGALTAIISDLAVNVDFQEQHFEL